MVRIILDSDDEDEDEGPLESIDLALDSDNVAEVTSSEITPHGRDPPSGTRSTGSTVKLQRDLLNAHGALMATPVTSSTPGTRSDSRVTIDIPVKERDEGQLALTFSPQSLTSASSQGGHQGDLNEADAEDENVEDQSADLQLHQKLLRSRDSVIKVANSETGRKRRKIQEDNEDEKSNDLTPSDELAIGLPKEQYKPRASRSRAKKTDADQTECSQTSVEVSRKRRRTTRETDSGSQSNQADEQLDELVVQQNSNSGKSRRRKSERGETTELQHINDDGASVPVGDHEEAADAKEEANVATENEQANTIAVPSSKTAPIHIGPEDEHPPISHSPSLISKKKGRGRPRKTPAVATPTLQDEELTTESTECSEQPPTPHAVLQDADPNSKIVAPAASPPASPSHVPPDEHQPSKSPPKTSGTLTTLLTKPVSRPGATPYRVGLSRNSKIPSLLKTKGR